MHHHHIVRLGIGLFLLVPLLFGLFAPLVGASSHREAPLIANDPAADNTDFYMFRSPEDSMTGEKTVTFLANYIPLQTPSGGPNFHFPANDVLYAIKIDNNGDAEPDIVYEFRFNTIRRGIGDGAPGDTYLYNSGPITSLDDPDLLVRTYYTVHRIVVDKKNGKPLDGGMKGSEQLVGAGQVAPAFAGRFSYCPDQSNCTSEIAKATYEQVAASAIAGTADHADGGRVWVGPRQEAFYVDLGKVFDLARLAPLDDSYGRPINYTAGFNVTTIALKVPLKNLVNPMTNDPVIGAWATASRRMTTVIREGQRNVMGPWRQVSRLGSPLVNEVVIGAADKDRFNATEPKDDVANFGGYVLQPRAVKILNLLYNLGLQEDKRADLVQIFVTGIPGLTRSQTLTAGGEMLRINTAIEPKAPGERNDLGVLGILPNGGGADLQGFPNGRRPTDDVTDAELTALTLKCSGNDEGFGPGIMGPNGVACTGAVIGDGVSKTGLAFTETFPYLPTPLSGNP
jgi:hypothetical protein